MNLMNVVAQLTQEQIQGGEVMNKDELYPWPNTSQPIWVKVTTEDGNVEVKIDRNKGLILESRWPQETK